MIAWNRPLKTIMGIVTVLGYILSAAAHTPPEITVQEPSIVHVALADVAVETQQEEGAPVNGHCHACSIMGMSTPAPSAALGRSAHRVNWPFLESSTASLAARVEPPPPRRLP